MANPGLRIGTSGYQYRHWKGVFYPEKLPVSRRLAYYADRFDTVEINNTFYRLPSESTFDSWRDAAPAGFLYALKFSRFATHMKKLKEPEQPLALFMERAERLKDRLGPILVQLPPRWRADPGRLAAFLELAPQWRRWAVELRDPSWLNRDIYALLRQHNAALCLHDLIPEHPWLATADWVYIRFHGGPAYDGDYTREQLARAAERIEPFLQQGRDVFVYFNNDAGGAAVRNALELRALLTQAGAVKAA